MKTFGIVTTALFLAFGVTTSRAQNLDRISAATGVPVATLQAERDSTGLGWGSLEKAHLLANATGQSFDDIAALHQSGQGWGKIARDNGLSLGRLVSNANRSSQATTHAQNLNTAHGKTTTMHGRSTAVHSRSATSIGRGQRARMNSRHSSGHVSSSRSGFRGFHSMHSMGHMGGFHGGSMGHGGGHGR